MTHKEKRHSLESHTQRCIFIGFEPGVKGWKCYNPKTKKNVISREVIFDEDYFPGLSLHPKNTNEPTPTVKLPMSIYEPEAPSLTPTAKTSEDEMIITIQTESLEPPVPSPIPQQLIPITCQQPVVQPMTSLPSASTGLGPPPIIQPSLPPPQTSSPPLMSPSSDSPEFVTPPNTSDNSQTPHSQPCTPPLHPNSNRQIVSERYTSQRGQISKAAPQQDRRNLHHLGQTLMRGTSSAPTVFESPQKYND